MEEKRVKKIGEVVASHLPTEVAKQFKDINNRKMAATQMFAEAVSTERKLWKTLCEDYDLVRGIAYIFRPEDNTVVASYREEE